MHSERALGDLLKRVAAEGLLLGVSGGLVGVGLAYLLAPFAYALRLPVPSLAIDLQPTMRLGVAAFGISTVLCLLLAVAPLLGSMGSPLPRLRQVAATSHRPRWMRLLIGGQIAITYSLLVVAALMVRSAREVGAVDPGLNVSRGLLFLIDLPVDVYKEAEGTRMYREVLAILDTAPEIESASFGSRPPLSGFNPNARVARASSATATDVVVHLNSVAPGYFGVLSIPLLEGRPFQSTDTADSEPVAIVSQSVAHRVWGTSNVLGESFRFEGATRSRRVVGVAANTTTGDLTGGVALSVYVPLWQEYRSAWLHVQTSSASPTLALPVVKNALAALDPEIPVTRTETVADRYDRALATAHTNATLATALAAVVVLLTLVGLYGVMTYAMSLRQREFGIRIAVGATTHRLIGEILYEGLTLAAAGIIAGFVLSLAGGEILASFLYRVQARDPWTLAGVAMLLTTVSAAASWIPARRATDVEPAVVLRTE